MNYKDTETIEIDGHPLRLIQFKGPFFRSDYESRGVDYANEYYANRNGQGYHKYFTKSEREAKQYKRPYLTEWMASEPLRLVDILHIETRNSLEQLLGPEHLKISFPINTNKNKNQVVYRYSQDDDIVHDNAVLDGICNLGHGIDGYYMEEQNIPGNNPIDHPFLNGETIRHNFHSEIGLCKDSLHKLEFKKRIKGLAPPPAKKPKSENLRPSFVQKKRPNESAAAAASASAAATSVLLSNALQQPNASSPTKSANLSAMLENNARHYPVSATKKRSGNNNGYSTPPRKTAKQANHKNKNTKNKNNNNNNNHTPPKRNARQPNNHVLRTPPSKTMKRPFGPKK
jgi:hypothetical protein